MRQKIKNKLWFTTRYNRVVAGAEIMKKSIVIGFSLAILALCSVAQEYQYVPFPTTGAVWSEEYNPGRDEYEPVKQIYERFSLPGEDTLINNYSYKKLYYFTDSVFDKSNAKYLGGIREDEDKRVYYIGDSVHWLKPFDDFNEYNKNIEILLYDFSLEVGDTLFYGQANVFNDLIVEKIDTIQIGNYLRRKFIFEYNRMSWIEGIGSLDGLLFATHPLVTGASSVPRNFLICFIQTGEVLYHNDTYTACFPITNSIPLKRENQVVKVYPNPANTGAICFEWGNNSIETIEVFNLQSILVGKQSVLGKTSADFSTKGLHPGIYTYKANSRNNRVIAGKFIVH